MFELLPPGLILIVTAALIAAVRGPLRLGLIFGAPLLVLLFVWNIPDGVVMSMDFLGYPIQPIEGSPVRRLFATVFSIMTFAGALFAYRTARPLELAAAFAYAGGAVGVAFAGDLLTMFIFWEAMAIFSMLVVWSGGTEASRAAGIRYGIIHLLGGVILKAGIEGVYVNTGSLEIQPMLATGFDTWMILLGVLINAAAPPISAWLSDAYPETSPTGMVFLSAYTTKTAVLALILLFPGEPVLIWVGLYMVFYGIIYALLENDARRILAYSIVNQVGFMVTGIGIGTEMAINGAAAHAFAHIIYKALLLMSAGVVMYRTGKRKCTDLGGLFRTMPITAFCGIIGALAISGFPLTSGFTTKTMISEAAALEHLPVVWYLLAAASAGVFLHAGIKFPWFVFFQKDSGMRPKDAPWNMAAAMLLMSAICIILGVWPDPLYATLPYPVEFEAYKAGKVVFYLQLLLFSGLAFFLLLPWMKRTLTVTLDWDWLYRRMFPKYGVPAWQALIAAYERLLGSARDQLSQLGRRVDTLCRPGGLLTRTWMVSTTAVWIAALLTYYLVAYFF